MSTEFKTKTGDSDKFLKAKSDNEGQLSLSLNPPEPDTDRLSSRLNKTKS